MITRTSVAVVGGGPSGIAAASALKAGGVDCILLEKSHMLGSRWASKDLVTHSPVYDALKLNNSSGRMSYPRNPLARWRPYSYQSASHFRQYLERSAERSLPFHTVRLGTRVARISPDVDKASMSKWSVECDNGDIISCNYVVLASGLTAVPVVPTDFETHPSLTHSAQYLNASKHHGRRVLVVGAGNSGADIACDLAQQEDIEVDISCGSSVRVVPRALWKFPLDRLDGPLNSRLPLWMRNLFHEIMIFPTTQRAKALGLTARGGRLLDDGWTISSALVPLMQKRRITLKPRACRAEGRVVTFSDGTTRAYDDVIMATGYAPSFPALPADLPISAVKNECFRKIVPCDPSLRGVFVCGAVFPLGPLLQTVSAQAGWITRVVQTGIDPLSLPSVEDELRFRRSKAPTLLVDPYPYTRLLQSDMALMNSRIGAYSEESTSG